jgi:hypothetical protein
MSPAPASWSHEQILMFVRQVRHETREAWNWLTPRVQTALIAQRAFDVCRSQESGSVSTAAMDELLGAMLQRAGLEE